MKNLSLFCFLIVGFIANAQNLVPNPSFEEYIDCPFSTAELENQVIDWVSWSESPDFFHVCSNDIDGFAGVPANAWGYQEPLTGDAYAGFFNFTDLVENGREYIATQLLQPVSIGETYFVVFHVSLNDGGSKEEFKCATNHIGLRFFKDPEYTMQLPLVPDNFAHVESLEIIDETEDWVSIQGTFIADDNYNWLCIGNFYSDENTEVLPLNNMGNCWSIYYIDNVCVASVTEDCDELLSIQYPSFQKSYNVYPNPVTDKIGIEDPEASISSLKVINLEGKCVLELNPSRKVLHQVNLSSFESGFYYLFIQTEISNTTIKIIKL